MEQLLSRLKGEQFLKILEEHSFDENYLKFLNKDCLDDIIPKNLYGPRLEFEYHLKKWQEEQGVFVFHECDNAGPTTSLTNFLKISYDEISMERILNSSAIGDQVILYYKKYKHLNCTQRKLLSNCIVEYLIGNKIVATPKTFADISKKVEHLFPTENKDIYYIPIKGRKPAGLLYSKYHNSISKLRKEGVYDTVFENQDLEEIVSCVEEDVQDENQISSKDWLKYNVEHLNLVLQKWDETFKLRRSYFREQHSLLEIFEEWPLLKQSFGYKLITADFSLLYPEKVNLIFEKWEDFCKPILKLMKKNLKDSESLQLIYLRN